MGHLPRRAGTKDRLPAANGHLNVRNRRRLLQVTGAWPRGRPQPTPDRRFGAGDVRHDNRVRGAQIHHFGVAHSGEPLRRFRCLWADRAVLFRRRPPARSVVVVIASGRVLVADIPARHRRLIRVGCSSPPGRQYPISCCRQSSSRRWPSPRDDRDPEGRVANGDRCR